jgi:hypothetical protein
MYFEKKWKPTIGGRILDGGNGGGGKGSPQVAAAGVGDGHGDGDGDLLLRKRWCLESSSSAAEW